MERERAIESPIGRLRRWRKDLDRRHRHALRTAFSTRLTPDAFRRRHVFKLRLRARELALLRAIARRHDVRPATLAWSILSEWLAGTENPRMAQGLSLSVHGVDAAEAERLHELVHGSTPGGRFAPSPAGGRRRALAAANADGPATLGEMLPEGWWDSRFDAPDAG